MKRFTAFLLAALMVISTVIPAIGTDTADNTVLEPAGDTLLESFSDAAVIAYADFAEKNASLTADVDYIVYSAPYGPGIGVFNGAQYVATFTVSAAGEYEFLFENYVRSEAWDGYPHWGTVQIDDGTVYTVSDQALIDAGLEKAEYGAYFFAGPTLYLEPGEHTVTISGTRPLGLNTYFRNAYVRYAGRTDISVGNPFADAYLTAETALLPAGEGRNEGVGSSTWFYFAANDSGSDQGGVWVQGDYVYRFNVEIAYDGIYDLAVYMDNLKRGVAQITLNGETYNVYSSSDVAGSAYYRIGTDVFLEAGTYEATLSRVNGGQIPLVKSLFVSASEKADITSVTAENPWEDAGIVNFAGFTSANPMTEADGSYNYYVWSSGNFTANGLYPTLGKSAVYINDITAPYTISFTPAYSGEYDFALYLAHRTTGGDGKTPWEATHVTTFNLTLTDADGTLIGSYRMRELPAEYRSRLYYNFADGVRLEAGKTYYLSYTQDGLTSSTVVDFLYNASSIDGVYKEIPEGFADAEVITLRNQEKANEAAGSTTYWPWNSTDFDVAGKYPVLGKNAVLFAVANGYTYKITFTPTSSNKYSFALWLANKTTQMNGVTPLTGTKAGTFKITLSLADKVLGTYTLTEILPAKIGSRLYYEIAEDVALEKGVTYTVSFEMTGASDSTIVDFLYAPSPCKHEPGDAPTCTEPQICTLCGEVLADATGHLYAAGQEAAAAHPHPVYDICVCGEKRLAAETSAVDGCIECERFNLAGANMTLGNALSMNFYIPKAALSGTDYYAVITKYYADGRTAVKNVPYAEWESYSSALFRVTFDAIAAKEMSDLITVQVFDGSGEAVSNVWNDGIRAYLMRNLSTWSGTVNEIWTVDCLNYGAASQVQFAYNTADPANKELTEAQLAIGTQNVKMENNRVMGANAAGSSLVLKSNIALTAYFKNITDPSGMYAVAVFTNHRGTEKEQRVDAADFRKNGSLYGVQINSMAVADARQMIAVTMYNGDGSVYGTYTDSVEGYAARMTTGDDLYMAVMKFASSSYDMFHQDKAVERNLLAAQNDPVPYKEVPAFNPVGEFAGIKAITYDGVTINGQKTKVFAYIGFPEGASAENPVPAVVLVHGSQSGIPYAAWVKEWNDRGYAAISMSTNNFFPLNNTAGDREYNGEIENWNYGLYGEFIEDGYVTAPRNQGMNDTTLAYQSQWMYHAIAQVIHANNLLRADARVDSDKIGISGISWGATVTSLVIGYDTRFAFAIPIYGSGYLTESHTVFADVFSRGNTPDLWLAEDRFSHADMPILWLCWNADAAFSVNTNMLSYADTVKNNADTRLAVVNAWGHSHGSGWGRPESYVFADSVCKDGAAIPAVLLKNGTVTVENPGNVTIIGAKIYYLTTEYGYTNGAAPSWLSVAAEMQNGVITTAVPSGARAYYYEVTYTVNGQTCYATSVMTEN